MFCCFPDHTHLLFLCWPRTISGADHLGKWDSGSFSCSAPRLWNALPHSVREAGSLDSFKKNLKNNFWFYLH